MTTATGSFNSGGFDNHSGSGYYAMGGTNDYVQWTVNVQEDSTYPISVRYSLGDKSLGGNRPLKLNVNDNFEVESYDMIFTDSSSYWRYSDIVNVPLDAGDNTIRLTVFEQDGGVNVDHLRVGKPPAIVIKLNGWPRAIAKNGLGLLDDYGFAFTNETTLYLQSRPDPPLGDIFQWNFGRVRLALPQGARYLDIGNPRVDFTGYEQYLPQNHFIFDGTEVLTNTSSDLFKYPMHEGLEVLLENGLTDAVCQLIPPFA